MPLRERPSLRVLAGQPHGDSLADEAGEGEGLGVTPVDAPALEYLWAPLQLARELGVEPTKPVGRNVGLHGTVRGTGAGPVLSGPRGSAERLPQALVRPAN